ncbi:MAG: hypothetical protein IPI46_10050 [Bacteroidetes bacterium]|nr:hypothetical protein [Bacteroidota bacterium]
MKENIKPTLKISHVKKPYIQPTKISLDEVRQYLNDKELSEHAISDIREFAYLFGELLYKNWTEQNFNKQIVENEESNIIYQSEYRRAS